MIQSDNRQIETIQPLIVSATCRICKNDHQLKVNEEDFIRFQNGEHIQNVMPYLSADERELFITGLCGKCFDKIFADAFADEEDDR